MATPDPAPNCPTCASPLVPDASACTHCGAPVQATAPVKPRRPKRKAAVGFLVVLAVLGTVVALLSYGSPADPPGRLLPTDASVAHAGFARLVSCRRVNGVTDVKVRLLNGTATATDVTVTVEVTNPTSGASYDAVVGQYAQLDAQHELTIKAVGTRPVPAQLACQVLRIQVEKGT